MVDIVNAVAAMQPPSPINTLSGLYGLQQQKSQNQLLQQRMEQENALRQALQGGNLSEINALDPRTAGQYQNVLNTQKQQAGLRLLGKAERVRRSPNAMALWGALRDNPEVMQDLQEFGVSLDGVDMEGMTDDQVRAEAGAFADALRTQLGGITATGTPAGIREFEFLTRDMTPEQRQQAAEVAVGVRARAGDSAAERIAREGKTDEVAESEAEIAGRKSFAQSSGTDRAKRIDDSFTQIQALDSNIRTIDRAIAEIDAGASTGVIESRFLPTFRESTLKLEQIQRQLGLDVVGSVTFGALSEGELALALETALPVGLQPAELRAWLVARKDAQQKLRDYYAEQVDWLDQGGTIPGFLRSRRREQGGGAGTTQQAPRRRYNPATGEFEDG